MNQEDTLEILTTLTDSIKNRGLKKTIALLQVNNLQQDVTILDDVQQNIVDNVCTIFKVKFNEIYETKYTRGENKYTIGFIVYYLYQSKTLRYIQKNVFKNRTKALLSRYKQLIFDLEKNKNADKRYIDIKNILDKELLK